MIVIGVGVGLMMWTIGMKLIAAASKSEFGSTVVIQSILMGCMMVAIASMDVLSMRQYTKS